MSVIKRCVVIYKNNALWKLSYMTSCTNRINVSINQMCGCVHQYKPCAPTRICQYGTNTSDNNNGNKQVYYGILTPQIRAVKIFSLLSSVTGLLAQPILISQIPNFGTPVIVALYGFVGFFTFVTPLLLHMITKKYVTYLHFNPETEKYTATRYTFFLRNKMVSFTPDDVVVPDVPGMFTSFQVKGSPLFVDPRFFEDPTHYAKLMGYDKPIDFKLGDTSTNESSSIKK